jgi:hypothetical protein
MSGRMIVMTIAMALGLAGAVFTSGRAQTDLRWRGAGGWGPDSNYGRLFNSGAMTTVKGTVKDLETLVPSENMFKGVTMNVKTDSGEVVPVDFVANAASLGADAVRARTREEFEEALVAARNNPRTSVVVVEVDGQCRVPGYESWWDVAVAEVSKLESVQEKRAEYEEAQKKERYFL